MILEPAIEVRDEKGQLMGFANECDLPPRDKLPAVEAGWAEPVMEPNTQLVSFHSAPRERYKPFEHVWLKWERYQVNRCIYWCVMAPRAQWPKLLHSSNRYRETEVDPNPFGVSPAWASLDSLTSYKLCGRFLAELFIRRAA